MSYILKMILFCNVIVIGDEVHFKTSSRNILHKMEDRHLLYFRISTSMKTLLLFLNYLQAHRLLSNW